MLPQLRVNGVTRDVVRITSSDNRASQMIPELRAEVRGKGVPELIVKQRLIDSSRRDGDVECRGGCVICTNSPPGIFPPQGEFKVIRYAESRIDGAADQ